jgi:hypothetical protein
VALYERLLGIEESKIPVHPFMAAIGEIERGKMTEAELATAFTLSVNEQLEVSTLLAKIIGTYDSVSLGAYNVLSNVGAAYDAINPSKGLGAIILQIGGIEWFRFGVRVIKVGTGTQSWQLWNETDGAEVCVIDDAGAAGEKSLSVDITPAQPYAPAMKVLRVRAKSAVATDDPVFLGASICFRRRSRMTSVELHEVLILGEQGCSPYDTASKIRTRLGV